ncbi:hypothetical protein FI667_g6784, partial [Globisporangium splendens]
MKFTYASTTAAAVALAVACSTPSLAAAEDIRVTGARATPMMQSASGDATTTGVVVKIATHDILNSPTALVNKNTLAMDNNVAVTRSNIVFLQNDRLALKLGRKVERMVTSADARDMSTATLSKNVMKVVSGKDTDTAIMTKASAAVAAKDDATTRSQRIADLVNAAMKTMTTEKRDDLTHELGEDADDNDKEQDIQSQSPRGVTVLVGTKDILHCNWRQHLGAEPERRRDADWWRQIADVVASGSAITAGDVKYRVGFLHAKKGMTKKKAGAVSDDESSDEAVATTEGDSKEQFGF